VSEDLPRPNVRRIGPAADAVEIDVPPEPEDVAAPTHLPAELETAIGAELASSIQRLTRAEGRLRAGGEAEDVHQMRVATRRLRSTLRVFRPALEGPWTDRLRRRLSALADVLGDARDADVMLMRLDERIATLPDVDARSAEPLRTKLEQQCTAARAHLLEHLDGTTHKRLLSTLSDAAARPRFAASAPTEPLIASASEAWASLAAAIDALPEEPSADELHRVRLRTKRVRYTAETLAPVTDGGALRFARRAADLQDVLGRIQDARVARSWLRSVGVRATPRVAYVAGLIAGLEGAEEDAARGDWRRAWKRLDRKKMLSWLEPTT
jgi:CHAD domain-containing protein